MKEILKLLNLSDDAIDIYVKCLGENLLTFNEIHSISQLSIDEINQVINELIENQILIKMISKNPKILPHYMAIPPFFIIKSSINQIKKEFSGKEGSGKIENEINLIFQKQNKIELEKIYKDFQILQKDVNNDIITIKYELEELVNELEKKEESTDILDKYEQELKNIINSELASIVIILLHLKEEFQEKIESLGITDMQWNALRDSIKDILALGVHEKSKELNNIVTNEFSEIREIIGDKISDVLKDRFEQKSVYLGILNLFKTEIDKLHKLILLKKNNLDLDLKSLKRFISSKMAETFQNLVKKSSGTIEIMENFFVNILKDYYGQNKFILDKFWSINSKAKIREEITNLLVNSMDFVIIIVPEINDYINIQNLENLPQELKITIISSESHKSNIVREITKKDNIEFLKLKNNNIIGLNGDDSYIVFGVSQNSESTALNDIVGFGTDYKPIINLFKPIFSRKLEAAKPPKEVQIISELQSIALNSKSVEPLEISVKEEESINSENVNNLFEIFLEKIRNLKGTEISKQIENMIDLNLKFQGYSNIIKWKNELKSIESILDTPLIEKIKEDFKNWKNSILTPKLSVEPIQKEEIIEPQVRTLEEKVDIPEPVNLDELEYINSRSMGISKPKKEVSTEKIREININEIYNQISQELNGLKGFEISYRLQNIMDIILETKGFSIKLKDMNQWISKLRMIRNPLEGDVKNIFLKKLEKWKAFL